MIWVSHYWKDDLLKAALELRRRREQKRWVDASFARLEQRIMLGFYSVRKLRDSHKISDSLRRRPVPLQKFVPTGEHIDILSRTDIDDIYKIDTPQQTEEPLEFVCNQIIHSYVFTPGFDEQGFLDHLLFASDRQKDAKLFSVKIDEIVAIFEEVGNNYPSWSCIERKRSGDRTVTTVSTPSRRTRTAMLASKCLY